MIQFLDGALVCLDKMDVMIKKKVEDAMPIATGLEREELKVKLEVWDLTFVLYVHAFFLVVPRGF